MRSYSQLSSNTSGVREIKWIQLDIGYISWHHRMLYPNLSTF